MRRFSLLLLTLWTSLAYAAPPDKAELKMFITAAFVSESGLPVYREIADYVATKIGRKVVIVSGASYTETDMLLERGIIHVGFVCGLPYVHSFMDGKYSLLATPVSATRTGDVPDAISGYEKTPGKYYSYTIVHKDSKAKSWADLKGKRYAFNDINSNSGYNMPRYKLVKLGARSWDDWFSKVVVSGSHEESIRMVARHGRCQLCRFAGARLRSRPRQSRCPQREDHCAVVSRRGRSATGRRRQACCAGVAQVAARDFAEHAQGTDRSENTGQSLAAAV